MRLSRLPRYSYVILLLYKIRTYIVLFAIFFLFMNITIFYWRFAVVLLQRLK